MAAVATAAVVVDGAEDMTVDDGDDNNVVAVAAVALVVVTVTGIDTAVAAVVAAAATAAVALTLLSDFLVKIGTIRDFDDNRGEGDSGDVDVDAVCPLVFIVLLVFQL